MKINAKKYFGIEKNATVKATVDLVDEAQLLQIKLLESEDSERADSQADAKDIPDKELENKGLAAIKEARKLNNQIFDFIQHTMKYTDKQMETIKHNKTQEEVGRGIGYLIMRLQGLSDERLDLVQKKQNAAAATSK